MAYDLIAYLRDKFPALATPLGETQCLELVEQFLDHLRVIAAHDGVARIGLGKTAADAAGKLQTNGFFRDDRQEALCGDFAVDRESSASWAVNPL